ncbi:MAG TPA: HDIG domain-containing protein [Chitinophagaceae bacterium]|nr:HDIG domain-containing protein [Chitinophagaceae bacterium]
MIKDVIEEVFGLYILHGDEDYIGEPVSQLEHMLQAGELARKEGYDDEVVLAAFFHDIGHLLAFEGESDSMSGYGQVSHESKGAQYLRERGFSERLAMLVESHVEAKRYLTYKYPEYYDKLSEASKKTLEFQGGVMGAEEAKQFELDPNSELKIKLRLWDDEAKNTEPSSQTLVFFRELAEKHLSQP